MSYMEEHPDTFDREDKKRIYATILHHSIFAFDERTNRANFPLALRTINSLTPMEQASAVREGNELLSKMAVSLLKHVREEGDAFEKEANILDKLGRVSADLQNCKDRVAELEAWKTARESVEEAMKAEQEAAEKALKAERVSAEKAAKTNWKLAEVSKAKITVLTVEKSQIDEQLSKKTKELTVARNLANSLLKKPPHVSLNLMATQHKEELKDLTARHGKELMNAEGQLFDAEEKCKDLEMQIRLLTHLRDDDEQADDDSGDVQHWKNMSESSRNLENIDLAREKTTFEQRLDDQHRVILDLQSQLKIDQEKIGFLNAQVASLSLELVDLHAKSADHGVETLKLKIKSRAWWKPGR